MTAPQVTFPRLFEERRRPADVVAAIVDLGQQRLGLFGLGLDLERTREPLLGVVQVVAKEREVTQPKQGGSVPGADSQAFGERFVGLGEPARTKQLLGRAGSRLRPGEERLGADGWPHQRQQAAQHA